VEYEQLWCGVWLGAGFFADSEDGSWDLCLTIWSWSGYGLHWLAVHRGWEAKGDLCRIRAKNSTRSSKRVTTVNNLDDMIIMLKVRRLLIGNVYQPRNKWLSEGVRGRTKNLGHWSMKIRCPGLRRSGHYACIKRRILCDGLLLCYARAQY